MKRLKLVLCVVLTLIFVCSCAGTAGLPADDTRVEGSLESGAAGTPDSSLPDRLAEARAAADEALSAVGAMDFEGMSFIITSTKAEGVFGESFGVTTVSKEKHMRLKYISEKLNVNIVSMTDYVSNMVTELTHEKNSGVVYTHLLLVDARHVGPLYYYNVIGNVEALPYVDTSKPYYDQSFCEEMKTPSGLYALYGEALRDYEETSAVFYNETLAERLGAVDLEGLVYSGGWSYDKMNELARAAQAASSDDDKLYGILNTDRDNLFSSAYTASGIDSVDLDGGSLSVRDNTSILDAVSEKLRDIYSSSAYFEGNIDDSSPEALFSSGKGLFLVSKLEAVEKIYNMPNVWGVLPLPTASGGGHLLPRTAYAPVVCYPSGAADVAATGIMIESIFASSYKIIDAAYADTFFHYYVRNEKSMDMLVYLFGRERSDFALCFAEEYTNFGKATLTAFADACTGDEAFSSIFARNRYAANRSLGYIK